MANEGYGLKVLGVYDEPRNGYGLTSEGGINVRILAFTDLHGDIRWAKTLFSGPADLYLCLGDVTNGNRDDLINFLRVVGHRKFLMVPGNNELPRWIPNYFSVHGDKKNFMGVVIGGIGGSPVTPFGTVFEWDEDYAYETLENLGYVDIFLSHTPPKGTRLAITKSGVDAGSEAVLWYIETFAPLLALVGHIHERSYLKEYVGGTLVYNPGRGSVIDFSLNGEISIHEL